MIQNNNYFLPINLASLEMHQSSNCTNFFNRNRRGISYSPKSEHSNAEDKQCLTPSYSTPLFMPSISSGIQSPSDEPSSSCLYPLPLVKGIAPYQYPPQSPPTSLKINLRKQYKDSSSCQLSFFLIKSRICVRQDVVKPKRVPSVDSCCFDIHTPVLPEGGWTSWLTSKNQNSAQMSSENDSTNTVFHPGHPSSSDSL